jgi:hypothetical protein
VMMRRFGGKLPDHVPLDCAVVPPKPGGRALSERLVREEIEHELGLYALGGIVARGIGTGLYGHGNTRPAGAKTGLVGNLRRETYVKTRRI